MNAKLHKKLRRKARELAAKLGGPERALIEQRGPVPNVGRQAVAVINDQRSARGLYRAMKRGIARELARTR